MTLYEQLVNKIHEEQEQYLAEIEKLTPQEIIYKAYEICYRNEISLIIETTQFSDELMRTLLKLPNPIAQLYDKWLKTEDSVCEMLEHMISNYAE